MAINCMNTTQSKAKPELLAAWQCHIDNLEGAGV